MSGRQLGGYIKSKLRLRTQLTSLVTTLRLSLIKHMVIMTMFVLLQILNVTSPFMLSGAFNEYFSHAAG